MAAVILIFAVLTVAFMFCGLAGMLMDNETLADIAFWMSGGSMIVCSVLAAIELIILIF